MSTCSNYILWSKVNVDGLGKSAVSSKHAISTRKEFLTYKTHNEQQPEFVIVPVEKSLEDTL